MAKNPTHIAQTLDVTYFRPLRSKHLRYGYVEPNKNPQKKKILRVQARKNVVKIDSQADSDSAPVTNDFELNETINENNESVENADKQFLNLKTPKQN